MGYVVRGKDADGKDTWADGCRAPGDDPPYATIDREEATEYATPGAALHALTLFCEEYEVTDVRIYAVGEDGTETPLPSYEEALEQIATLTAERDDARTGDALSEEQTSELWHAVQDALNGEDLTERLSMLGIMGLDVGPIEAVRDLRAILCRVVTAWREDEIGQVDGALIEEAEALLGIEAEPDPLAVKP